MNKEIVITLFHEDIIELLELDRIDFNHTRNEQTPTGIKAFFNYALKGEEQMGELKLEQMAFEKMIELGYITDDRGWWVNTTASHSFSDYDDEGYAHSIYRLTMELRKRYWIIVTFYKKGEIWIWKNYYINLDL